MKSKKLIDQVVLNYAVSLGAKEDEIIEFFYELKEIGKSGFKKYYDYMKKTKIRINIGEVTLNDVYANFIYKYTGGYKDIEEVLDNHPEINKDEIMKDGFVLMDMFEKIP